MVDKDKDSSSSTNNNNSSSGMSKASDVPVNYITDRDRELIETILDAHRATLPGGPIVIHKVSCVDLAVVNLLVDLVLDDSNATF